MALLHDPGVRDSFERRVRALRADSQPRWGRMTVDQMLWHVAGGLALALGDIVVPPRSFPLPRRVVKFIVLELPWVKNVPTLPAFLATGRYDFEGERGRCLGLIQKVARRPLNEPWPAHPICGRMSGAEASALQAKHLNHHLEQFGV